MFLLERLVGRRVYAAVDEMTVDRRDAEVVDRVSVVVAGLRRLRFERAEAGEESVNLEKAADVGTELSGAGLPRGFVRVEGGEVGRQFLAVGRGAASVLVRLDLVELVVLLDSLEVEGGEDVLKSFIEGVGADAEGGVGEAETCRVDVGAFEAYAELTLDLMDDRGERLGEFSR